MTMRALRTASIRSRRNKIEFLVNVLGVLRVQHAQAIRIVMPGVTMRNASEKVVEFGRRALFTACQAMIIAMTVVLPAPVAILQARR